MEIKSTVNFFCIFPVIFLLSLISRSVVAQETKLSEIVGTVRNPTLTGVLKTAPDINKLTGAERVMVTNNMALLDKVVMNTPCLRLFKGFETRIYGYIKPASTFEERTTTRMEVMFYPYTLQYKTKNVVPVDEAPAILSLITNDLNAILFNVDGYWDLCNEIGFPQFFEKFPVLDSTSDYLEVKIKGFPFRILELNNKPIFIPLTRKEFLTFLVVRSKNGIASTKKVIASIKDQQEHSKNELKKPLSAEMKKMHEDIVKSSEKNLLVWGNNLYKYQKEIQVYENDMKRMSIEQASTGAYMNYGKSGDYYNELAAAGRKEGQALYKVNPEYFNPALSSSVAQVTIITYWHSTGNIDCPEGVVRHTKNLFDQINYHQLKTSLE